MSVSEGALTEARASATQVVWVAMAVALAVFAALQLASLRLVGSFEYPLDDVYIHLAVAEQIAAGNYGVNPGEVSSPASSPLYPLLLLPFAGTELQRMLPLLWNIVGLLASAALFGRILIQAGLQGWPAIATAAAAPLLLNMSGIAAIGMEHSLHMAASLAILSGLFDMVKTGRIGALLVVGIVLAPALRPEGLALSLLAAGAVALNGRWTAGIGLAVIGLAPQVAFAGFLAVLGLDPVPSSVLTKLGAGDSEASGLLSSISRNLSQVSGLALLALTALSLLAAVCAALARAREAAWIAFIAAMAGGAHLIAGKIGWLNRYEPYAIALVFAGVLAGLAPLAGRLRVVFAGGLVVASLALALQFVLLGLPLVVRNPLMIHLQQGQMARFAQDYAKAPVAVNDLGWVSWTSPNHVLDLWGLASSEARRIRLSDPAPGWGAPLAAAEGVRFAMIYDQWLGDAVGAEWVRLGTLSPDFETARMGIYRERGQAFVLGDYDVAFYATDPEAVPALAEALEEWAASLPGGARFEPAVAP
ncbi:MAG: hypothetical protein AAFU80_17250 [Pseudomonadota bacterium]